MESVLRIEQASTEVYPPLARLLSRPTTPFQAKFARLAKTKRTPTRSIIGTQSSPLSQKLIKFAYL